MFTKVDNYSYLFSFNGVNVSAWNIIEVQIDGVWCKTDMVSEYNQFTEEEEYSFGIVVNIAGIAHSVILDPRVFEKITDIKA